MKQVRVLWNRSMAGTIAQQPALIGSTAVENAHKLISGKGIPASIPVEVALITIENAKKLLDKALSDISYLVKPRHFAFRKV